MGIQQISVFLNDQPGTLCKLASLMMENDISIRAMSIADSKDFGIVRFIVSDPDAAVAVFGGAGYVCSMREVLAFGIEDKAGAMYKILDVLCKADINIDYSYAFTVSTGDTAYIVARVEDVKKAAQVLTDAGANVLDQKTVAEL